MKKVLISVVITIAVLLEFVCFGNIQEASASNANPNYLRSHNWYTRKGNMYARWHFSAHGAFYATKKLTSRYWDTKYKIVGKFYSIGHGNAKSGWNVFGAKSSDAATYFRYKKIIIDGKQMNTFQEFEPVGPGGTGNNYIWIYTSNIKYANQIRRINVKRWFAWSL